MSVNGWSELQIRSMRVGGELRPVAIREIVSGEGFAGLVAVSCRQCAKPLLFDEAAFCSIGWCHVFETGMALMSDRPIAIEVRHE